VQTDSSLMAGLGWIADIQGGRMSALTYTGLPDSRNLAEMNGS